MNYRIETAKAEDLSRIGEIYAYARSFMAKTGNPNQWGSTHPPAAQLQKDWASYQQMADYVTELKTENARLDQTYRAGYDLEDIEMKALAMGLVPGNELKSMAVTITIPEKVPVMTWDQKVVRFWNELWA